MIKRIIFVCLVALIAYYAGAKGLTPANVTDWFNENKFAQTIKNTIQKTLEFAEDKQLADKAGDVINVVKENVSD
ncbi:MAG: hypothetical protein MAG581_01830 [Deltaproteobacteria bacterium]|jgi:hypothetical protein|nr:hypothetical protein [Deltaproteobacteria bacterium]